jgi:uncharacterized paraquat-inducible protein A
MTISTRTPEGWPSRCPVCGKKVCVEPSRSMHDATCPHCGVLLWLAKKKRTGAWLAAAASLGAHILLIVLVFALSSWFLPRLSPATWILLAIVGILIFGRTLPEIWRGFWGTQ